MPTAPDFANRLLAWFDSHGRFDLPWQHPRTPYRVWVSEIMLQQTQVGTVIGYFNRFMLRFPDLVALAQAPLDAVLAAWSGLGYYARARNLHAAARRCLVEHGGELPREFDGLHALPGIGRSTAAAILAQAHGERHAILDGNVKRVLARWRGIHGDPGTRAIEQALRVKAESLLPHSRLADYTQALMDFGATVCMRRTPGCATCPLRADCLALRDGHVHTLPTPRPRRVLPLRHCVVLLLRDPQARVLLHRRPPRGIWGGLWSLPQFDDAATARDWIAQQPFSRHGGLLRAQAEFTTVFTHFRLAIRPHFADVALSTVRVAEGVGDNADEAWLDASQIAALGLPQPIRKLMNWSEPCHAPCSVASKRAKPRDSRRRPSPGNSACASTMRSAARPGSNGLTTRRC